MTSNTAVQENAQEVEAYGYGYTVGLEPGEAAPEFAKHVDVEEADSGWDKVERVHRIAYTTENQQVARENGFALVIGSEPSFSWGTIDNGVIEPKETEHDIYTDAGAAAALEEQAEVTAVQA
jgi:hypothetical protein